MTKNRLKLIAALTMVVDHIGIILFPEILPLRYIGRLSFPLYAFCIGDGCLNTKKPKKYFLRIFILGLICQIVFAAEELCFSDVSFPGQAFYFNVLFTFSFSVILCCRYIKLKTLPTRKNSALFIVTLFCVVGLELLCRYLSRKTGAQILFDYQSAGAILPLFAVIKERREERLAVFSVGLVIFALLSYSSYAYILFTFLALPVLWLYNEKPGKKGLRYGFYLFYPLQFLILYSIKYLVNR